MVLERKYSCHLSFSVAMFQSMFFVLFLVVSSYSEESFLESLPKCSIRDSACLKLVAGTIVNNLADNGLPETGISVLDPKHIQNLTVTVIGLVDLTMVDGYVEGMKNCKMESFDTDIDTKITKFDVLCDVFTIRGIYNVKSAPLVDQLFGSVVAGEGNGSIVMEKLKMNFTNPFNVEKHEDGEFYLVPDFEKAEYSYEVLEKVTFKADHITLGVLEIAPLVTSFMNRHWKNVMASFSQFFSDKGMELSYETAKILFNYMPAKKFIIDDLSKYLQN